MKIKGDMIKNSLGVKKTKNSYISQCKKVLKHRKYISLYSHPMTTYFLSKLDQKKFIIFLTYIFDSDEKNL